MKKILKLTSFLSAFIVTGFLYIRNLLFPEVKLIELGNLHEDILYYFCGTKSIEAAAETFISATYNAFPMIMIIMIWGEYIYKEFTVDNVYHLIRYKSRLNLYFTYIMRLTVYCFIEAILFTLILLFLVTKGEFNGNSLNFLPLLCVISFSVIFGFSVVQNLISFKTGKTVSFLIVCIFFISSMKISLLILAKNDIPNFWFRTFIPFLNFFLNIVKTQPLWSVIVSCLLSNGLIVIIGFFIIKHTDIGVSNKELI